jgi:Hemerythrin HHE cation binding domain
MTDAGDAGTSAVELLRGDHDEIRRLLSELEACTPNVVPAGAEGQERLRQRGAMVDQVVITGCKHEAVEEQYFWPVVRRRVRDGVRLADQAVSQELRVKHVLDLLDGLDPAHPEFEPVLRQFAGVGRAHLDFEESKVWPGVRLALSEQELADLGAQLEQGKRLAPTRPHPSMPPDPQVQKLAGRIAGATDRIRDVLTGRTGI